MNNMQIFLTKMFLLLFIFCFLRCNPATPKNKIEKQTTIKANLSHVIQSIPTHSLEITSVTLKIRNNENGTFRSLQMQAVEGSNDHEWEISSVNVLSNVSYDITAIINNNDQLSASTTLQFSNNVSSIPILVFNVNKNSGNTKDNYAPSFSMIHSTLDWTQGENFSDAKLTLGNISDFGSSENESNFPVKSIVTILSGPCNIFEDETKTNSNKINETILNSPGDASYFLDIPYDTNCRIKITLIDSIGNSLTYIDNAQFVDTILALDTFNNIEVTLKQSPKINFKTNITPTLDVFTGFKLFIADIKIYYSDIDANFIPTNANTNFECINQNPPLDSMDYNNQQYIDDPFPQPEFLNTALIEGGDNDGNFILYNLRAREDHNIDCNFTFTNSLGEEYSQGMSLKFDSFEDNSNSENTITFFGAIKTETNQPVYDSVELFIRRFGLQPDGSWGPNDEVVSSTKFRTNNHTFFQEIYKDYELTINKDFFKSLVQETVQNSNTQIYLRSINSLGSGSKWKPSGVGYPEAYQVSNSNGYYSAYSIHPTTGELICQGSSTNYYNCKYNYNFTWMGEE